MVVRERSPKLSVSGPSFARLFQLMEARGRDVGVGFNTVFLYQVEEEKNLSPFFYKFSEFIPYLNRRKPTAERAVRRRLATIIGIGWRDTNFPHL